MPITHAFPKKELDLSTPKVMGVLNLTPDSFFDGGKFLISGTNSNTERILFTDNNVNLLKVDTQNKKVTLLESTSDTEYYIGIGTDNPQEKVHLAKGNLKVDNTGYFGDLYVNGVRVGGGDAASSDLWAVSGRFEERTDYLF